jgi:hypothetical protein
MLLGFERTKKKIVIFRLKNGIFLLSQNNLTPSSLWGADNSCVKMRRRRDWQRVSIRFLDKNRFENKRRFKSYKSPARRCNVIQFASATSQIHTKQVLVNFLVRFEIIKNNKLAADTIPGNANQVGTVKYRSPPLKLPCFDKNKISTWSKTNKIEVLSTRRSSILSLSLMIVFPAYFRKTHLRVSKCI